MNVQQVIDRLTMIEDKAIEVFFNDSDYGIESVKDIDIERIPFSDDEKRVVIS